MAYDIPNDKRRSKLHQTLCGKDLVRLRAKLDDLIEPDEDSVRIYPLCAACQKSVETIGSALPEEKITMIF